MSTVGLLHPGEMGAAIGAQIRHGGHTVLWCPRGRSAATRHRADDAGLLPVSDLRSLLGHATVVLSICPPSVAEEVAGRVADIGYPGLFVDANAVSPALLRRILTMVREAGASTVDGAIIGAPPGRQTTRLYLAGDPPLVRRVSQLFTGSMVEPVALDGQVGRASALKMAFASFQKASRVLAGIAHALADEYGVTEELLVEAERMPSRILSDRDYLPTVARRAWRWAPEMREIARTLDAEGLPPDIAEAVASVLVRWAQDRDRSDLPTGTVLDQLRAHRQRSLTSKP
jgi:3-hydroxyisobutyrate dehydrogenase-like beta-hydroxyacid dehydrogenase